MVTRDSHVPLYEQIEDSVRRRVHSGELPPLSQVESETELATAFSVSRMTARKALDSLVREGLLFRRPGKGTFVSPAKIPYALSTQLSFSAAIEASGHQHQTAVLESGLIRAPAEVADALSLPSGSAVVFLSRLRSVDGEPAAVHSSWLPGRYTGILDRDLSGSLTRIMVELGIPVAFARDRVEAVPAHGTIARQLQVPSGTALIKVTGTAHSLSGGIVRYTVAHYRGDRFSFSIDTSQPADLRLEIKPGSPG